jgi:hypothetical protein
MYFILGQNTKPRRWIDDEPFLEGISFWRGAKIIKPIPSPLEYTLKRLNKHAEDHAPHLSSMMPGRIPLFREDLIAALRECGVTNVELYDAAVKDPDNGQTYTNYKAVNILGLIAAADMAKSGATVHPGGPPLIDVEFDHLEIDLTKTRGVLMFRLAEAVATVLVHAKVRDHLLAKGFDDLAFYVPREAAV